MHRSGLLIALLAAALSLPSCSRSKPRNIVVIVGDTLRADRLGVYGSRLGLTPFIDRVAARGTVFANAYATSSWTNPSVASLFTSRYPSQHHVAALDSALPQEEVCLAEILQRLDYERVGFSANIRLTQALGFAQGFDLWHTELRRGKPRTEHLRPEIARWLGARRASPALLYLQLMEPHAPYEPLEPHRSRFQSPGTGAHEAARANDKLTNSTGRLDYKEARLLLSLYNGEVASFDGELQRVFEMLEPSGFLDDAIIVITADHGEEFREHGGMAHGNTLFNEAIRVPLIVVAPGYPRGRVVDENVSLVDVAPTLLELVGLPVEPRFEGRSLVPLLAGASRRGEPVDVVVELPALGGIFDLRRHTEALIRSSTKVVVDPDGRGKLYDLATDPRERAPEPPALAGVKAGLLAELRRSRAERETRAGTAERKPLDEATKEHLRGLGYATH